MRKIFGLILSLALVFQLAAVSVSADNSTDTEPWNTAECFGIIKSGSSKDGTFTIADMSEMLYHFMNISDSSVPEATRQIYTDVDRWHNAAGYIEWLYLHDVYTGDGSGNFEPDRTAMLSDVCGVMLNLLGYGKLTDLTGDMTNPITKAIEVKILPKSVNKTEHEITYGEFADICYETLFADVVKMSFADEKRFINGGEFIDEVLNLQYGEGVMTSAGGYSFTGVCENNYAVIGNKKLYAPGIDGTQLGYNVKYYYDKNDNLVGSVPVKNDEIVITSADEPSYSNNSYKYEQGSKYKRARTDIGVMLLYNGKTTANRNAFVPSYGSIKLIDNDRDGIYDCVIVEDVFNIILDRVSNGVIYGKNSDSSGKKYVLDTEKPDLLKITGIDGRTIEDLKENTVITAARSEDGKYVSLYVTEKNVSGVLSKYNVDEGIEVDDVEYDMAADMYNPGSIVSPGNDVTVLFDLYGNAAALIGSRDGKYRLGYLIETKINDEDEQLVLKILTEESTVKKIPCSRKLYIDDSRPLSLTAAENQLTVGELIKYSLKDDEIRNIDTALHKAGNEKFIPASDSDSLRMFSSGNMLYKSYPQIFKKNGTMTLGSEFAVDDDTVVFFVPSAAEYKGMEDYYVASRNFLGSDLIADVRGYVTGEYKMTADAAVVIYDTSIELATSITVVDKVYKSLNGDNEIITVIKGMSGGKDVELTVSDSSVLGAWGTIAKGSVIRCRANKNGDVRVIDNLYGLSGTGLLNTNANHTYSAGSSGVNANVRVMLGRIYSHNGTLVEFDFKDNVSDREVFNLKNCNFYVYDQTDGLRLGNTDDIYDVEHYGTLTCDDVIICTRAVAASDVILIKKN